MRWLMLCCAGLLLAAGCDESSTDRKPTGTQTGYVAYDSPDHLIANLTFAWERRDLAEYRDSILYKGIEEATDGEVYEPFKFYYDRSLDPDLPVFDPLDREWQITSGMFSGLPGPGVPGIGYIRFTLTGIGDWAAPEDPNEVEGDPCPAGTLWRSYSASIQVSLKANIDDTDIHEWWVEGEFVFHCIPVQANGGIKYKLWKWREVIDSRVETMTWGQIRMLYRDP